MGGSKVNVEPYSELLWKLNVGTGGYCVMMKPAMIRQAIEYLKKEDTIADLCYMKCMANFRTFRTKENLVIHKAGYSLLKKQEVDYPELR